MQFHVLGPLEVRSGGEPVTLRGVVQRATLGCLLVNANRAVSTSRLVDALWGEDPPPTARKMLQNAVSALRLRLAGGAAVVTRAPGYALEVAEHELDVHRFHADVERGRGLMAAGDPAAASAALRAGLDLWRGPALADLIEAGFEWPEPAAMEKARLAAFEDWVEAELALGRHADVLGELEAAVADQPARERMCGQLMLALYRSGRQADALGAFRGLRTALGTEFGLDPGRELQELERAILHHDEQLAGPVPATPAPEPVVVAPRAPAPAAAARPATTVTERKWVSVLLVHTGPYGAQDDDPEAVDARARILRADIEAEVAAFGGTLHGSLGAVWFAVFGTRRTHEDDAERAIRAGCALRRRLGDGNRPEGAARVAVATGEALVTRAPGRAPADVSGEVVETCMRLLSEVAPGAMVACPSSRLASRGAVTYAADGDVVAVRPEHESASISGPFVGRRRDLAALEHVLRDVRCARRPHQLTLLGEPGIGKTRLVRQFRSDTEARTDDPRDHGLPTARFLAGRAPRFGRDGATAPLAGVLRELCGIGPADDAAVAVGKLEHTVRELVGDPGIGRSLVTTLRPLVERSEGSPSPVGVGDVAEAWVRLLEQSAARRPLVVVLEDLQSADDDLLDLVEGLDRALGPVPLLLVCTARTELVQRRPSWAGGKRDAGVRTIGPLTDEAMHELVRNLLARELDRLPVVPDVAPSCVRELVATVGGNPLFAAEHVLMLRNERSGRREPSVPSVAISSADPLRADRHAVLVPQSVHSILAARLDTLPQLEKSVLQDACVLDRLVSAGPLAAIGGRERARTAEALHELNERGMLVRTADRSAAGDVLFALRHAVLRDIAYSQLPRTDRAARHRRCADWLREHEPEATFLVEHHTSRAGGTGRRIGRPGPARPPSRPAVAVSADA